MITNFNELFEALRSRSKKRMVAAWGVDDHTITAAARAIEKGIVEVTLVGDKDMILDVCKNENIDPAIFKIVDNKNELQAIAQAVGMVKDGEGDILMKGLCSTDKYMRGILNKERGLLPPKAVLSHITVIRNPNYHKFLIFSDAAVIPAPDFKQKQAICKYLIGTARALGIDKPKVAAIAATEQMLDARQDVRPRPDRRRCGGRPARPRRGRRCRSRSHQEGQERSGRRRRLPPLPEHRKRQRLLQD